MAEYRGDRLFAQFVHEPPIDSICQIAVDGEEYWYHKDLVGSTRVLTDKAGAQSARYRYSPFGLPLDGNGPYNPLLFSGMLFDAAIASYNYRTRQYSPALGRFLQRDALPAGNLYLFVDNNPLTGRDVFGRERESVLANVARRSTQIEKSHDKDSGYLQEFLPDPDAVMTAPGSKVGNYLSYDPAWTRMKVQEEDISNRNWERIQLANSMPGFGFGSGLASCLGLTNASRMPPASPLVPDFPSALCGLRRRMQSPTS
jgi:RHS repeat-associated protein